MLHETAHADSTETPRHTSRYLERTPLYCIATENLEVLLQSTREQNESGQSLLKYVEKEFRVDLSCPERRNL